MTDNTQELDVNKLEQIIADHNKEMRADMASEITGGTRSKAITDVITVKAILGWHNKQVEEVLDRLESRGLSEDSGSRYVNTPDGYVAATAWNEAQDRVERVIEAERKKLTMANSPQLKASEAEL